MEMKLCPTETYKKANVTTKLSKIPPDKGDWYYEKIKLEFH
jgi:hypothetical protein